MPLPIFLGGHESLEDLKKRADRMKEERSLITMQVLPGLENCVKDEKEAEQHYRDRAEQYRLIGKNLMQAFGASGIHSTLMDYIVRLKQSSQDAHRAAEEYWKLKTLFEERLNAINQNLPRLEQRIQKGI